MTATRMTVVLVVALALLPGCKKKSRDGDDTRSGVPGQAGPPGGSGSDPPQGVEKVIETLEGMARLAGQGKLPYIANRQTVAELPTKKLAPNAAGVGVNGSADRGRIDAAFARFWDAWEKLPDYERRTRVQRLVQVLTAEGRSPEAARAEAEKMMPSLPTVRITTPTDTDFGGKTFGLVEAHVANGVKASWSGNGELRVVGDVRFRDSLRIHPNGPLTARLKGSAGQLELHANGDLLADLVDCAVPVVEVTPNGGLFLRVGPETTTVRIQGGTHGGFIFTRGNPDLQVESTSDPSRQFAIVGY